jgi:hypothetical protein
MTAGSAPADVPRRNRNLNHGSIFLGGLARPGPLREEGDPIAIAFHAAHPSRPPHTFELAEANQFIWELLDDVSQIHDSIVVWFVCE